MEKKITRRGSFATLLALLMTPVVEAKGRKGSTRVGGRNSHGKGSHYRGGRK